MTDSWHWSNRGVDIEGDHLLWYDDIGPVSFAGGGASTQSFEEFLAQGPPVDDVPADVLAELRARLAR